MKPVLDPCSGSRMFYFNPNSQEVIFGDIRSEKHILCDGRVLNVCPDILMDVTNLNYPDNTFKLIVFDPPHLTSAGPQGWIRKKYGVLPKEWKEFIAKSFNECWRVLDNGGTLIFKWSEVDLKVSDVLNVINQRPLFGHRTMQNNRTIWMCFFKSDQPQTSEGI